MKLSSAGLTLEAEIAPPQTPRAPLLILAHPHPQMGGTMQNKVIDGLFRRSAERGWGAVRFNFRGVGESGGAFDGGAGETDDLLGVLRFASVEFDRPEKDFTWIGYSFGAWICAKASATLPALRRLVLIAPPVATMDFSPLAGVRHAKHVFAAERDEIVPLEATEAWYATLDPPKTLQVIPEATHTFVGQTTELLRRILQTIE